MNTSATYGQRSCLFCGKAFEAGTLYQFFCSSECCGQRRRQQKAAYRARFKDRITALKKRVADLEEEIEFLKRTESHELKEARKELDQLRAKLEHTQLELARKQAELDAAREKVTTKVAEPVALKHIQKENTRLKSYVKELEERLQACGAMV